MSLRLLAADNIQKIEQLPKKHLKLLYMYPSPETKLIFAQ